MNLRFASFCLASLGCAAGLVAPVTADAGNVGYYKNGPSHCTIHVDSPAAAIVAAGHTPVLVNTLDAASLAPLQGLVVQMCDQNYQPSAAVDSAVANGMAVMIDGTHPIYGNTLPGRPALDYDLSRFCDLDYSLFPGAAIASGPGGSLTDLSFDPSLPGMACSFLGSVKAASLPAGAHKFVYPVAAPNQVNAFAYSAGEGVVVVSVSQMLKFAVDGVTWPDFLTAGASTYYTNSIAWMMDQVIEEPAVTCASEGYTGTKLTWCQNICEKGYTGSTLNSWIKRWTDKYRDLPYCAREK